VVIYEIYIAP